MAFYLGPLIGQLHLRQQLYNRKFRFLWHASRLSNCIVKACIDISRFTSNTYFDLLSNKFVFLRSNLHLDTARLSINTLDQALLNLFIMLGNLYYTIVSMK